jgi:hypothetical protein
MAALIARVPALCLCGAVLIGLLGCEKAARDDMSWAQAALERNGQLQVLTVDRQARAFTVRLKDTGELRIVRADEVVGALPQALSASAHAGPIVPTDTAASTAPASDSLQRPLHPQLARG